MWPMRSSPNTALGLAQGALERVEVGAMTPGTGVGAVDACPGVAGAPAHRRGHSGGPF